MPTLDISLIFTPKSSIQFSTVYCQHDMTEYNKRTTEIQNKTKNKKIFWSWELTYMCRFHSSGACPTNDTRTKPETRPKSDALRLNTYPTDHNEISHTPRLCNGRDVCKTAPRSAETPQTKAPQTPIETRTRYKYRQWGRRLVSIECHRPRAPQCTGPKQP